jgi:excisionase family DNA binding protein
MDKIIQRIERLENLIITTQKQVLNINELCTFTGLSKSTIYKLTMSGNIPHYKQSKHLYFDRDEVITWLKETRGYNAEEIKEGAYKSVNIGRTA